VSKAVVWGKCWFACRGVRVTGSFAVRKACCGVGGEFEFEDARAMYSIVALMTVRGRRGIF
jgi:hypothetical protein